MNKINFNIIIKSLRIVFIFLLSLDMISHTCTLINIQKNIFDIQNVLSLCLILSFIFINKLTTIFLLFYFANILSMIFFHKLFSENIYHTFFLGINLSSFIRLNITKVYWVVTPIMNLSYYLAGYIILMEIPYRLYKDKKSSNI